MQRESNHPQVTSTGETGLAPCSTDAGGIPAAATADRDPIVASPAPMPASLKSLDGYSASAEFVAAIPIGFARQWCLLGLASPGPDLPVATAEPVDYAQLQVIGRYLQRAVRVVRVPAAVVQDAINAAYQQRTGQAQGLIETLDSQDLREEVRKIKSREDLLDVASRAPVIKLVNLVLFEAVQARASDVHVQPYEGRLVIRIRIDGILYDAFELPGDLQEEMVSRIKVMGRMNIAEKLIAQDGRATVQVGDRVIDLRIASLPTSFGERVVIRLLDKSIRMYNLEELGMEPAIKQMFRQLIGCEHGIILVTGPTGSGKTTTLYAALQEINAKERNILTLEDPIEYGLEGISQTQISEKKGMTFASGLRHVLRQDPDIIMVGEIRDQETAAMAIQSALTGHLVFSTLHTNDAASAVARLLDLGIEPYLLASSLIGVLAQRLVRRVCPDCRQYVPLEAPQAARLGMETASGVQRVARGTGCAHCRTTGYRGRLGIFELLVVEEAIRTKIHLRATASEIKSRAASGGMKTMRDDGWVKIAAGLTTIDEVARVTMRATV